MARITKIEPNKIVANKIKVAAYCRVSTDQNEQLLSLETQKAHYESWIRNHDEWEYAGLYYDEGISGTKKDTRPALMQMLSDCEHGLIDHVVTKSISRLARNTTDCLEIVGCEYTIVKGVGCRNTMVKGIGCGNTMDKTITAAFQCLSAIMYKYKQPVCLYLNTLCS